MPFPRLPRFKRIATARPIDLTKRDHEIIRLVHRYRFLHSAHIIALIGGSTQQILRRLQLLFHHGFLERPRIQIDYYGKGGSRHIAYGLGNRGAKLLKERFGASLSHLRWNEKNQAVGRIFLAHALLVSDAMVAIELSVRNRAGIQFIREEALLPQGDRLQRREFRWSVRLKGDSLGLVPDQVFALDTACENGESDRAYFFLEADRGTMPVLRKNLKQTSIYRKLLAYETTWTRGLQKKLFGFHRFRVLIVTTTPARAAAIIDACAKLKRGHGLFLICDQATLAENPSIFDAPWKTGKGETATILP